MSETTCDTYVTAPAPEIRWHYSVPCKPNSKMQLLTVGGTQVIGTWYGKLGEYFLAYAPLIQRDKVAEERAKQGLPGQEPAYALVPAALELARIVALKFASGNSIDVQDIRLNRQELGGILAALEEGRF
jgi:hypothetical protein